MAKAPPDSILKRKAESGDKASEIAHSQKIAADAESIWGWSSPAGQRRVKRRSELLAQLSGFSTARQVLELGCGTGLFTENFADSGAPFLAAADISPELLHLARRRLSRLPCVKLLLADCESLPFRDESFDAVVGSSILHHLQIGRVMPEIRRVLRPGGKLAFAEPNMLNPQIMIQKNVPFVKRWLGDSRDERAFFRWSLKRLLQRQGFKDVWITPYDFLHPLTPKALVSWVERLGRTLERVPVFREIAGSLVIAATRP